MKSFLRNITKIQSQRAALVGITALSIYNNERVQVHPTFLMRAPEFMRFDTLAFCEEGIPYLGCSIRSLNDSPGLELVLVNSDSPAWQAGLKLGDIILEIDNKKVNNIQEYRQILL